MINLVSKHKAKIQWVFVTIALSVFAVRGIHFILDLLK